MKKILYLASTLKSCAPTTQLRYILTGLDRGRFEPLVLTMSPESGNSAMVSISSLGIEIRSLALSRMGGAFLASHHFLRLLKKLQPDLVHSSGFRPDVLLARNCSGLPSVATIRNYPYYDYPLRFGRVVGNWMAWEHQRMMSRFSAVVPCSHAIAGEFGSDGPSFHVIQDGVDIRFFSPVAETERTALRRSWGVGETERLFVSAGSLIPRKDPLLLIRAFLGDVVTRNDRLYILGDGPLLAACQRAASASSGRVRLLGHVADVRPFLRGADYYLSASHAEGLPNAVLEAMACGLPVALSDIPSHRELLAPDSSAGELFPVGDVAGLTAALHRLASGTWASRSAVSSRLAREHFDSRRMSQAYQTLYTRILEGYPGA